MVSRFGEWTSFSRQKSNIHGVQAEEDARAVQRQKAAVEASARQLSQDLDASKEWGARLKVRHPPFLQCRILWEIYRDIWSVVLWDIRDKNNTLACIERPRRSASIW